MIKLSEGWKLRGSLPTVEFDEADEGARELFDEDLVHAADPSGRYVLDVGWYPAENPAGEFRCRLIAGDDWESPEEEFRTRVTKKVREWVEATADAIDRSAGAAANLSEDVFVTLQPDVLVIRAGNARPQQPQRQQPPPMRAVSDEMRANSAPSGTAPPTRAVPATMSEPAAAHAA